MIADVGPGATRTLLAALLVCSRQGHAQQAEIALAAGHRGRTTAHTHLHQLRELGLVDFDDNIRSSVRITCQVVDGPWTTRLYRGSSSTPLPRGEAAV